MSDEPAAGGAGARRVIEALRAGGPVADVRWGLILVWFLRLMAVLWMMMGLMAWADVLGVSSAVVPFDQRAFGAQAIVVYFAVLNLVAAVGLWLTSTWGGIMWLLAVMSHLILAVFFPAAVASGTFTIIMFALLIAIYLAVSWLAAHDHD